MLSEKLNYSVIIFASPQKVCATFNSIKTKEGIKK